MKPSEKEALEMITEMCHQLIVVFAEEHGVNQEDLNIQINLENLFATPIFGILDKKRPLRKTDAKGLLKSSDIEPEMVMIVAEHVKTFIQEIFTNRLRFHKITDCKEVFMILSLKEFGGILTPAIRVYRNNRLLETEPIGNILG